jgi:glycosyltransferase involved in cell wall biosynthesis
MPRDLSVIITARNEEFLARTVEDVLAKKEMNTDVIVIFDGNWSDPPIPDHKDITIIYHSESIGQRQAINEGIKLSDAKYIMKLDAHCIVAKGFDRVLCTDGDKLGKDVTQVPRMYNLHVFDWKCKKCGNRWYQSPTPKHCMNPGESKGENKNCDSQGFERVMIWDRRMHKRTDFMRFDNNLKFAYWGSLGQRKGQETDIAETLSIVGACFFMNRERYWYLGGSEEDFGSWGQQGTEISCKTWLSGGRLVVNKKTWFSHAFRTQGGTWGFPYAQSVKQQENARVLSKKMFFNNEFDKQVRPLSWLIEHFWPIPDWKDEDLVRVKKAGAIFYSTHPLTDSTNSLVTPVLPDLDSSVEKGMTSQAVSLSGSKHILSVGNKSNMAGVATPSVVTDKMVKLKSTTDGDGGNQPSIHQSVNTNPFTLPSSKEEPTIPSVVKKPTPIPTSSNIVNVNVGEKSSNSLSVKTRDSEELSSHGYNIPNDRDISKAILYFTDGNLDPKYLKACQKQLLKANLPIYSVTLKPMDFGNNAVLPLKSGFFTLYKQILIGLELMTEDIVFPVDHDTLYHPSHFEFTPEKKDIYYYNLNEWRVRAKLRNGKEGDGFALRYDAKNHHNMAVYRTTLIKYYREKVRRVEEAMKTMDAKQLNLFYRQMGCEPGTHNRVQRLDRLGSETWEAKYPNIDIRHDKNLSASRWSKSEFRNTQSYNNWQEAWEIPFWGKTKGRFNKIIEAICSEK